MAPKALILMADYGNDPTEVAVPFDVFTRAGFQVSFATENGTVPACDKMMMSGMTGSLLGAKKDAIAQHDQMIETDSYKRPVSWKADDFNILIYDLVFLPGGHEKNMRQYIESKTLHQHLAKYVSEMRKPNTTKSMAAICHGVQVLAAANEEDSEKSIIHDFETTALPGFMEQGVFWATRLFLGDYYKTFGAGTPSVEEIVKGRLDDPNKQWKSTTGSSPFTHRDPRFRYISARFPPDATKLAEEAVQMVKEAQT